MKIEVKKFGNILVSRPSGKEAALAIRAHFRPKAEETIELDFSGVLSVAPSWLDEVLSFLRSEYGKDKVVCLPSNNPSVIESLKVINTDRFGNEK
jgi:hypothetical protein